MGIRLQSLDNSLKQMVLGISGLIPGAAETHYIDKSTGTAFKPFWEGRVDGDQFHTTITAAHSAMTTGRNDVAVLSPESHSQAASITWSKNMTHLIGAYGLSMMNKRPRIGHSANFDNLLNVTGYGNTFANLYFMYGRGNAANLTCAQITGNRNSFIGVHFGAPMNATEADESNFKILDFAETSGGDGLEHYFKDCVIGVETTAWTDGDMMKISGTPRLVFDNCIFLMRADNAQVTFLDGTAGDGQGFILFKNCTGINLGSALTVAIGSTGLAAATDIILHNSGFSGATDIIAAADEAKVKMIAAGGILADENIGLAIDADHTA